MRQLRYFVSVAREGNFSRAAEKVHIAQPALSRQIILLEEEFGVTLFNRTARGTEMTDAGRRFKVMAEYVLQYISEIKPAISQAAQEPSGVVVLGLPPSLASLLAPRLVEEVKHRFPKVKLRIVEGLSVFLSGWLENSRLDIAVLTDYGPIVGIDMQEVVRDEMVFVGVPEILSGYTGTMPIRDILNFPVIISHGFRSVMSARLLDEGITPDFEMELDSIPIVMDMLKRGTHCSIVSYSLVHEEIASGTLTALSFQGPPIFRKIMSAVSARRNPSLGIRAVEDIVQEQLASLPLRVGKENGAPEDR
nr:LysR family transcriptional regulator [Sphingobium subterraneum]